MQQGNDIVTTFIGGCALLLLIGITMVTIFSWIFS